MLEAIQPVLVVTFGVLLAGGIKVILSGLLAWFRRESD